jgi:hypothetical protein
MYECWYIDTLILVLDHYSQEQALSTRTGIREAWAAAEAMADGAHGFHIRIKISSYKFGFTKKDNFLLPWGRLSRLNCF